VAEPITGADAFDASTGPVAVPCDATVRAATSPPAPIDVAGFESFVGDHSRRLWQALVPIVGTDIAADATADALAHGWEHWARIGAMDNPAGYLYTVARNRARRRVRLSIRSDRATDAAGAPLPAPLDVHLPEIEPGLAAALVGLSEMQRQVVVLVEAFGWGLTDTARLLGVSVSTVRNHRARAMVRLRIELKVVTDG
jgi:RNA polymerase sigma-70 factor (ECF subfamily)